MKELIQVEIWTFTFSNTPILQYSKIPRHLYRQSHSTLTPAGRDLGLAQRSKFSKLNKRGQLTNLLKIVSQELFGKIFLAGNWNQLLH